MTVLKKSPKKEKSEESPVQAKAHLSDEISSLESVWKSVSQSEHAGVLSGFLDRLNQCICDLKGLKP